jgi:hypothetical protein
VERGGPVGIIPASAEADFRVQRGIRFESCRRTSAFGVSRSTWEAPRVPTCFAARALRVYVAKKTWQKKLASIRSGDRLFGRRYEVAQQSLLGSLVSRPHGLLEPKAVATTIRAVDLSPSSSCREYERRKGDVHQFHVRLTSQLVHQHPLISAKGRPSSLQKCLKCSRTSDKSVKRSILRNKRLVGTRRSRLEAVEEPLA